MCFITVQLMAKGYLIYDVMLFGYRVFGGWLNFQLHDCSFSSNLTRRFCVGLFCFYFFIIHHTLFRSAYVS
jgi:hypothetical protein